MLLWTSHAEVQKTFASVLSSRSMECLVHLSELSAALVAEPLAPGSDATLAELRDPAKRPRQSYGPLPHL